MFKQYIDRCSSLVAAAAVIVLSIPAHALDLNLSQTPLFVSPSVAPLNMLTVGRDHKLYYEAYNDYTDLNDDDELDIRYKPTVIDYYGYFDSFKCYTHDGGKFNPTRRTATKTCTSEWSGDFLNYLTTARIDALRKVLYGGYRETDSGTATVLERTYIPQDAHSWGKEYTSPTVDGYDLTQYAPLSLPTGGNRHLFANTTPLNTAAPLTILNQPLLRILTNRSERIWNWVSIERPVAGTQVLNSTGGRTNVTPTDLIVKVAVCVANLLEENCKAYGSSTKPIGLLQEFGENESMFFGLITGSYSKNTSGGVLRRPMDSIANEIDATNGAFRTNVNGVITSLNRMRVTGFNTSYQYTCGFGAAARTIAEGECQMWGNPIAEMMYEGVRYFAGLGAPTGAFSITAGAGEESQLTGGGLPVATWDNPYGNGRPVCAKPFQTVVSDINPSYDTDQLPGSAFASFTGDLPGLDVSALGQKIWNGEFGAGTTQNIFIGDVANVTDGAPTSKSVSSLGNIRGLSPEEPTKRGGYYAASVAHYGLINDVNPTATGRQNVQTFSVALASPLPKIEIPVGTRTVSLVPFAKSVNGSGISPTATFQPTDQIVDFYVDELTDTYGRFRVNFEDVEQGADHDMDAIAVYEYTVTGGTVSVRVTSEYAFGGITQHMGYVISGTTNDGIYLEVVDRRDGDVANDVDYKLDTPPTFTGRPPAPESAAGWDDDVALPFVATRTFTPGASDGATLLKDPLWYAAKWGGFRDSNNNGLPDVQGEWDTDPVGSRDANTPDNYFLVTNALKLSEQLRETFEEIIARSASASSAAVNSGSISSDSRVYQAKFDPSNWTGQLLAYRLTLPRGTVNTTELWDASEELPEPDARNIITLNTDGTPVPFRYASLDNARKALLSPTPAVSEAYVNFLRGDATQEGPLSTYRLRERPSKLGDIVSSSPLFVGAPRNGYSDNLESAPYSAFVTSRRNRAPMVYAGANDGMLHAFDGETGAERFAYIPSPVFANLNRLTQPTYAHRYYVDGPPNAGDVFVGGAWRTVLVGGLNLGGQGIYALNVTNPSTFGGVEGNPAGTFMWEFTDANDRDLGFTYSQPAIVRLQNRSWAAVFGNGYNNTVMDANVSTTGNAVLYIVDISNGSIIRKFDTGVGKSADPLGNQRPNGLATPTMVDVDGDGVIDHAYAGDLYGNMWKFDLRSTNAATWDFAFRVSGTPRPLFVATDVSGNRQPITVRPEVARGPYGAGVMVTFGTGKFLEGTDKIITPQRTQTFYGVLDNNLYAASDRITARTQLTEQTITGETVIPDPDAAGPLTSLTLRNTSNRAVAGRGWYLDLISPVSGYQGERSVTDPLVRDDLVIFTTLIPNNDPCRFGGSSWLMVLDLLSGAQLTDAVVDTNGDGLVDGRDTPGSGVLRDGTGSRADAGTCLSGECQSDIVRDSGSDGDLNEIALRSLGGARGRQSWRQIR